jgi:hypothetical protein
MKKIIIAILIIIVTAYFAFVFFIIFNEPKQKIQTVQIIQNGDTTLCTGYVHETQYFVKIFDTCNVIQVQYRGNFKINYK